jgi:hypothetical protein
MTTQKTFNGVTPEIFECIKTSSEKEHGTAYDPSSGNKGTATTETIVGKVVLGFDFDPSSSSITYSITSKPFIVSDSQIFDGIASSINTCHAN